MKSQADCTRPPDEPVLVGCDFGSTTAKAVVLSPTAGAAASACYALSKGNPIEDAKDLLRQIRAGRVPPHRRARADRLRQGSAEGHLGADLAVVETVAHAQAALHFFPDADVICDVGGTDVKVMILRRGAVADFRLNSQCSSGNGAFLQGVAERYDVPLRELRRARLRAKSLPSLAMGCGVFLQSDIVNQQRKGWSAEEIMASLAAVLPLNVWIYACQLQQPARGRTQVRAAGRHAPQPRGGQGAGRFHHQQGSGCRDRDPSLLRRSRRHRRGAVRLWTPGTRGKPSSFPRLRAIEALSYRSTTNEHTICRWCSCNCKRTFIDVALPDAKGRPWSKVPVEAGVSASSAAIPAPRAWSRTPTKCGW